MSKEKQQLEVAEKMIELMAKTIFALSHKTKSVEKCINNFKQQALSQMQKVDE